MIVDYIVSENCTHCCASQDAHNKLQLVLLMHGKAELPVSVTSAASGELFSMYNEHGRASRLVMMFRLEVGICLKTTTISS